MLKIGNKKSGKVNIAKKVTIKFGKAIAQYFPYNKIRCLGLRLCGFNVGAQVYVGQDLIIASTLSDNICDLNIEDRVAIGPRVTILLSSDPNWSNLNNYFKPIRSKVHLKNDCWIGAGAIIMPGVTIGEYSVVGSGSVVTRDVEPFTVVVGIPAKAIRRIK